MNTHTFPPSTTLKKDFKEALKKAKTTCLSRPIEGIAEAKSLYKELQGELNVLQKAEIEQVIGIGYHVAKDYSVALKHFNTALEIFQKEQNLEGIVGTQNWKALNCTALGASDEALKLLFSSLEICQEHHLGFLEFRAYTCLGATYQSIYNSEKAIECFEKALESPHCNNRATALSNLASIYCNMGKHRKALPYLQEAYKIKDNLGTPVNRAYITANLVIALGELHDYQAILPIIGKLKLMAEELKNTFFIHLYNSCMMGLYLRCRESENTSVTMELMEKIDLKNVLIYLQKTTKSADTDNLRGKLNACELLISYYELEEEWKEVSDYQKKLLELNALKFEKDRMETVEHLMVKHEVAQKEQKIQIQQLELENKELELEQKKELEKINQQLEEKVARRTARLTHQNQQLREFAFIVSHDLREPICNIDGITSLLQSTYQKELKGDMRTFVEQIGSSAKYMNVLLKNLLDYTILEQQINEKGLSEVDSAAVFRRVKESLKEEIREAKAKISVGSLPRLRTSPFALKIIFEHLLSNALKFRKNTGDCFVKVDCDESDEGYRFSFKDNGIGIDSNHQERIFRIFQRLNKRDYGGTGIGLAICKKAIEALKGDLFVESQTKKGSTFYFTISKS